MTLLARLAMIAGCYGISTAIAARGVGVGWRRGMVIAADQTARFSAIWVCFGLAVPRWPPVGVDGWIVAGAAFVALAVVSWFCRTSRDVLNFVVLQWFGVRLLRGVESPHGRITVLEARSDGRDATDAVVAALGGRPGWTLLRWVWPLTGWWSQLRWIARRS